jgi:hypothetical protein
VGCDSEHYTGRTVGTSALSEGGSLSERTVHQTQDTGDRTQTQTQAQAQSQTQSQTETQSQSQSQTQDTGDRAQTETQSQSQTETQTQDAGHRTQTEAQAQREHKAQVQRGDVEQRWSDMRGSDICIEQGGGSAGDVCIQHIRQVQQGQQGQQRGSDIHIEQTWSGVLSRSGTGEVDVYTTPR